MKRWVLLLIIFACCGCATPAAVPKALNGFQSRALLQGEGVLSDIRFLEHMSGRDDGELRIVKIQDRGEELAGFAEFWTVEHCGVRTTYKVRIVAVGMDRIQYSVSYPSAADMQ